MTKFERLFLTARLCLAERGLLINNMKYYPAHVEGFVESAADRRVDNQVVGVDGKTRIVVESERRPNGPYDRERVEELEKAKGIEVQTRPIPERKREDN